MLPAILAAITLAVQPETGAFGGRPVVTGILARDSLASACTEVRQDSPINATVRVDHTDGAGAACTYELNDNDCISITHSPTPSASLASSTSSAGHAFSRRARRSAETCASTSLLPAIQWTIGPDVLIYIEYCTDATLPCAGRYCEYKGGDTVSWDLPEQFRALQFLFPQSVWLCMSRVDAPWPAAYEPLHPTPHIQDHLVEDRLPTPGETEAAIPSRPNTVNR